MWLESSVAINNTNNHDPNINIIHSYNVIIVTIVILIIVYLITISHTYSNEIIALPEHTTSCKTKYVISSVCSENVHLMFSNETFIK